MDNKNKSRMNRSTNNSKNVYDDDDIPEIDKPQNNSNYSVEPLPESSRPRQDGPGGD